jgi:hypothetical protein
VRIELDDDDDYVTISNKNSVRKQCKSLLEIKEELCSLWKKSQEELDEMFQRQYLDF